MFKNNFVVAVKANGKVLREFGDTVYIPFGTEYSILLKNLFRKKVNVRVKIDGQDALDGKTLLINPHDSIDLKRFIKNGNLDAGNAFKFIEKTEKIEKHRGNRAEDGLITVEYEFEADWCIQGALTSKPYDTFGYGGTSRGIGGEADWPNHTRGGLTSKPYYPFSYGGVSRGVGGSAGTYFTKSLEDSIHDGQASLGDRYTQYSQVLSNATPQAAVNKDGITAPGSIQEQKFTSAGMFIGDGTKHVMTLQLKGLVDGQQEVQKPVTVTRLKLCSMCGTSVRQVAKFCHECGSSVEIL